MSVHSTLDMLHIPPLPIHVYTSVVRHPIVLGIKLFHSFEAAEVASSGNVPMPKPGEASAGGHAVCMVGYDDNRRVFIRRNSWGEGWGDRVRD